VVLGRTLSGGLPGFVDTFRPSPVMMEVSMSPKDSATIDLDLVCFGDRLTQILIFAAPQRVRTQRRSRILSLLESRVRAQPAPDRLISQLRDLHSVLVDPLIPATLRRDQHSSTTRGCRSLGVDASSEISVR